MSRFKRNPLLAVVVPVLVLALAAEAWLWREGSAQAKKSVAALKQKTQERDWLAGRSPALSEGNAQAIAADVATARQNIAELRAALAGRDPATLLAPAAPAKAIDVYFDIAAFVERTRALAGRAQVIVKPDERFGFATHANEGPEAELIPAVFQQRLLAQYLVEALIEARPRALLSVQRERPVAPAARIARNAPVDPYAPAPVPGSRAGSAGNAHTGGQAADFFELAPALSVRVPGRVESDAFRVEFTGQTPSLRAFLNTLAGFRLPVVVRSVEVEPLRSEPPSVADSAETPDANAPVPLVAQNFSKFAVVMEFVVLLTAPEQPAP